MIGKLIESKIMDVSNILKSAGKPKIFCIGCNKTGTTSLARALRDFNIPLGNQARGELLIHEYKQRNFKPIIKLCQTAQAFQDIPFSLPFVYVVLDQAFPGSKFILSVRDSPEEWYHSLVSFQARMFGNGRIPTVGDLKKATYRYKGFVYDTKGIVYGTDDSDVYNMTKMLQFYNQHNTMVQEYFRNRPSDLLVINLSDSDGYLKFCEFLNKQPLYSKFPWENRTQDIEIKDQ